jgi:hypothetical protein
MRSFCLSKSRTAWIPSRPYGHHKGFLIIAFPKQYGHAIILGRCLVYPHLLSPDSLFVRTWPRVRLPFTTNSNTLSYVLDKHSTLAKNFHFTLAFSQLGEKWGMWGRGGETNRAWISIQPYMEGLLYMISHTYSLPSQFLFMVFFFLITP